MSEPDGQRESVLVVEDERDIRELLARSLRYAGFEISTADTGAEAVRAVGRTRPDLMVLDVMLPDMDGFDVLKQLGSAGHRPAVVFLTARGETEAKLRGLAMGDDYLTKPFSLEELEARIRAVLRRMGTEAPGTSRLTVADLVLDEDSHEVWRAGTSVHLSATEFRLLHYLMVNAGRVVSKAQIRNHVWQYDYSGETNVVELYVSYVRRKVDTVAPKLIHTLRGIGYVLRAPRE
ncbi:response regulator transcription factor [Actinocatenispora rupis]|uniref:DNA-binding response regulator n=1 Tax=Actinocatenispora rupis TaxID=519421 RepID=A0A8J3NHD6_9ACTN|nr:response regulator transcription factor [Actinocatenispora rupis]GID15839.1 DNA-binding response regulator [Actinocatenispora rupis]